jgi:hypothetical protein
VKGNLSRCLAPVLPLLIGYQPAKSRPAAVVSQIGGSSSLLWNTAAHVNQRVSDTEAGEASKIPVRRPQLTDSVL